MKITRLRFQSWLILTVLLGCAGVAAAAAAEWKSLFNGKDLAGWAPVHDVTFTVQDGNMRLVKGMGWLRSEKEYRDFVLELEWRALVPDYDSGIFIRAGLPGKPWPDGGWQVNLKDNALGALVKGYKVMVPAETPKKPVNQWVKFRIEARGKQVTLDIDGERNWESDLVDSDHGYIGIQVEERAFEFRNIRLQELPAASR